MDKLSPNENIKTKTLTKRNSIIHLYSMKVDKKNLSP